jgi:GNAT superfamily N-acetyltransferase
MSTNISLIRLTKLDSAYLDQVEPMFYDYYKSMEDKGLLIKIVADGGKLWRKSIENGLGKIHNVVIAIADEKAVGFIWGYIHLSPSYTGNVLFGVWNGLYVLPEFRSHGISKLLYMDLEKWYIEKKAHSIEAQVLPGNQHSMKGMKKMGFQEELLQLRNLFTLNKADDSI